jgi:NAD(P)-dependent dehydrogenase (short-subunit alcohol dehydrogenase family)
MTRHWAVILGASVGTGAAVAREVARRPGLDVFGMHRGFHPDEARAVVADVEALGRRAVMAQGDAGTHAGAVAGAEALLAAAGPRSVKLFVHSLANASLGSLTRPAEAQVSAAQVAKTFDSMAHSFVYWTQELMRRDLLAPEAQVLGLSNPLVDSLVRNGGLITATKAALEVYVRHLAYELGPLGHRVNLLKFGAVVTAAMGTTFSGEAGNALRDVLPRIIPAGRMSTLEEVARFVAVLAGDDARWFNGATIDFTGAQTQSLFDALVYPRREPTS